MRFRMIFIVLLAGIVVAVFTYPSWRTAPQQVENVNQIFPELTDEQRTAFAALPEASQHVYNEMRLFNAPMSVDLLQTHLQPREALPPEEQALPPIESAVIAAQGTFAPIELADDDTREVPPFNRLYNDTSGTVTIYQFPDNRKLLRIENLNVINGPNLRVILSTLPTPLTSEEVLADRDRIDVALLRTNVGSQNYESVPVEIDLANYSSIILYEATYGLIFGVAQLE